MTVVRDARPGDEQAIARVHTVTWQAAYAHVFPEEALAAIDVAAREEMWRAAIEEPPPRSATFVAERNGDVVGFAGVGAARDEDVPGAGRVYAIYVAPQAWGTGAGAALMARAEDALRQLGFEEAILWVLDDNPRARRFYERSGWVLDGAEQHEEFFGQTIREVRYRRDLRAAAG